MKKIDELNARLKFYGVTRSWDIVRKSLVCPTSKEAAEELRKIANWLEAEARKEG